MRSSKLLIVAAAALVVWVGLLSACDNNASEPVAEENKPAERVVNVYSARHYDTDDALYKQFEAETGIKVNVIEGSADELLTRMRNEGDLSPADIFITVDAGRLHKAVEQDIFQPTSSEVLDSRVPAALRHPDGLWYGLSKRVRAIVVKQDRPADDVTTYEQLAEPRLKGEVLIRSSSNIYNQSLVASLIVHHGADQTQDWAAGVVANMARRPQGGDTDQLRALAAGEGSVAVANHYYFARMLAGDDAADREAASKLRLIFPNQGGRGAHVNVSGAGVVKGAPNADEAVALLEFLTTKKAQSAFAVANHEYPVVEGVALSEVLEGFGTFKEDTLNAAALGEHNREAVQVMDRAGWR